MAVARYADHVKATLDDAKVLVDDLVRAQEDGNISLTEAITIALKHSMANVDIWKDMVPLGL